MRLEKFINEATVDDEKMVSTLRKECSQWLEEMGDRRVWRGFKGGVTKTTKKFPRQDRRPLDMPMVVHNTLDDLLKKKFGWKPRSQGVFVANDPRFADNFGKSYLIWPCNGYKYIYNKDIGDLYQVLQEGGDFLLQNVDGANVIPSENWNDEKIRNSVLKKLLSGYTDKGLVKQWPGFEIMMHCPNGYWVFGEDGFFSDNYWDLLDGFKS